MGYNVSKTERDLTKRYENRHYQNQKQVKVTHHNSYKRRRSSRRKQRSDNALQHEYDSWLRALSLDHDNRRHSLYEPWQKQRGPWHSSLQEKVSSLLNSRKHKKETIVWPQELVDAQILRGKKGGQPPSVRLTFTTNQEQYEAIQKKLNRSQRSNPGKVSGRKVKKRPKLPIDRRRSEFEYRDRPSNDRLHVESFHSSNADGNSFEKERRRPKQRSSISLNTSSSLTSSGHSFKYPSVEKPARKKKNKGNARRRKSKDHSRHMWAVPDEYNAIQVVGRMIGPQIRRSESPPISSLQPSASFPQKRVAQKAHSSNYDSEFETFYSIPDGFQIAGEEDMGTYGRSPAISPAFQINASDRKLDRIMTEVGDDFKRRFSVSSSLVESLPGLDGSLKLKKQSKSDQRSRRRMSHDSAARFLGDPTPESISFTNSSIERKFGEKGSWNNDNYKENWRLANFPSQHDDFILTRTSELCAKTLNKELNKLGYKDVIAEMNDSPLYIKHSTPSPPLKADSTLPGEVLSQWSKDKSVPRFKSSSKESSSPYMSMDRHDKDDQTRRNKIERRVSSFKQILSSDDSSSVESHQGYGNARDDIIRPFSKPIKDGSFEELRGTDEGDVDFIDELTLEIKISEMVRSMLGDKLGINRQEKKQKQKKKRPPKNQRRTGISSDDVENIIETQLAAVVAKLMIPPK